MADATESGKAKPRQVRHVGWVVAAATVLIPLGAIALWALTTEEDASLLKRPAFEAARDKWIDAGIRSYDLDLAFSGGDQKREIHLEVRNGEVAECLENGRQPSQKGAWDDWTIDNQFKLIASDLDKAEGPGFNVQSNVMITLHADFEPTYGYPLLYHRKARGRTPLQSKWTVVKFEPIASPADGG